MSAVVYIGKARQVSVILLITSETHTFELNRIYHRSLAQTEKPQSKEKQIMLETELTDFQALSIIHYPRLGFLGLHQKLVIDYFLPISGKIVVSEIIFLLFPLAFLQLTLYYNQLHILFGVFPYGS